MDLGLYFFIFCGILKKEHIFGAGFGNGITMIIQ